MVERGLWWHLGISRRFRAPFGDQPCGDGARDRNKVGVKALYSGAGAGFIVWKKANRRREHEDGEGSQDGGERGAKDGNAQGVDEDGHRGEGR